MKLIDTSVVVDHLRGFRPATELLTDLVQNDRPVASELTRFELLCGMRDREQEQLEAFCTVLTWIPVTEEIARSAADFGRTYRRSHVGIGAVDYVLAATATILGAALLTTNVRHFPMFEGLVAPYRSD